MKRAILLRGLLGFPLGVAIGFVITIFLSLGWGGGEYIPCHPDLIQTLGSEIAAVCLQAVLSGVIGTSFAACSVVWEQEHWSILKQTSVYFLITALVMMTAAYVLYWMEHTLMGCLTYLGIFIIIFATVWLTEYLIWRSKINRMNKKLNDTTKQEQTSLEK